MATQGIDFSRLTLQDALDLAILIEEEAEERYEEFAHQMDIHHTPEAATFFRFMARNEARHRTRLAERRRQIFADAPCQMGRGMLWDVEAPEYDEARAFITARQALEIALRSEEKAHRFFVTALPEVRDPGAYAIFEELREEEVQHQELVRQELAKLPPDPAVSPEDFTDEPTGQ